MFNYQLKFLFILNCFYFSKVDRTFGQTNFKLKFDNSSVYAGIDIGAKGIKLSILEIGKNAQQTGSYNVLKDTAVNTDFISFTPASYDASLTGLNGLYDVALKDFGIPANHIFTDVSSGIKDQVVKENKATYLEQFIVGFRAAINEPGREVPVIDVREEARLSHLGIVPESKRFTTFLIDIGSGNTKGGFFPSGDLEKLKLFQLSWGTKSTANTTEKRCEGDKSLTNFERQLERVLWGAEHAEIIYAVNESGAYPMSDNIAFSGGIAWSLANLIYPELVENSVVPLTYNEVSEFYEKLSKNYSAISDSAILQSIPDNSPVKSIVATELKKVHKFFDQKALLAGTGLLLRIMRQFEGVYEKKQFFLVKNGQVGWISAYVNKIVNKHP